MAQSLGRMIATHFSGRRLAYGSIHGGGSQNSGFPIGGPQKKDYNILGSLSGSPYLGKLPHWLPKL